MDINFTHSSGSYLSRLIMAVIPGKWNHHIHSKDGASLLNTTVIGGDRSYSNSLFTEGRSAVVQVIDTRTGILTDIQVKSSGSIRIDEFTYQTEDKVLILL